MKILLVSTSDFEGGAARATYRLHQGFHRAGITSQILVQRKLSSDPLVVTASSSLSKLSNKLKLTERIDALPLKSYSRSKQNLFSPQWTPEQVSAAVKRINPDIINLHWVCKGFLRIETLAQFQRPVVLTLHDMWAFTGGCHYSQDCNRYIKSCGVCPQLQSSSEKDLSYQVWKRKAKAWNHKELTVVTPSRWLAECARQSSLFQQSQIKVIPYGLDTQLYKPLDRRIARDRLNLPQEKLLVLFGAMHAGSDTRKGLQFLPPALQKLNATNWVNEIELIIFGASQPNQAPNFGFKARYLGNLNDDVTLALAYAAANVFVAPSMQDNLPNTVMEALACGTPCVAFNIGGMPDLIDHQSNGYLAQPYNTDDLAAGIAWVLESQERRQVLCQQSRQKVEKEFTLGLQAQRYSSLFKELLGN